MTNGMRHAKRLLVSETLSKLDKENFHPLGSKVGIDGRGVYVLYRTYIDKDGIYRCREVVYVGKVSKRIRGHGRTTGKSTGKTTIFLRLRRHATKIHGRQNIKLSEMECKWIGFNQYDERDIEAIEAHLISTFGPAWNDSGFGSCGANNANGTSYISPWDEEFPLKERVGQVFIGTKYPRGPRHYASTIGYCVFR